VASGFSRKAAAVVNLWIASHSLPPEGGSHATQISKSENLRTGEPENRESVNES
jgi:hypothetical protein